MKYRYVQVAYFVQILIAVQMMVGIALVPSAFGSRGYNMPDTIDPGAFYFFFLHNYYVETKGADGDCKYDEIVKTFSDGGYVVISELRTGKIVPCVYSEKIVSQVQSLLAEGVPPDHIFVAGHSKGGAIALCVATQLKNPDVNFVVMAGCEIGGIKKHNMYPDFAELKGNMLSIYSDSDTIAGSCEATFAQSSGGLHSEEVVIESDTGHRLFFVPKEIWVEPVMEWIKGVSR